MYLNPGLEQLSDKDLSKGECPGPFLAVHRLRHYGDGVDPGQGTRIPCAELLNQKVKKKKKKCLSTLTLSTEAHSTTSTLLPKNEMGLLQGLTLFYWDSILTLIPLCCA